ncbi:MAG: chemotaxis protein CheC [bacterium]
MSREVKLTPHQLDALREMGGIGAGNAATALSQLLGRRVEMSVPKIYIVPVEKVTALMGEPEKLVVGVYLRILGDVLGSLLLSFPRDSAFALIDVLMGRKVGSTKILSDMDRSALKETGNIVAGAYLNALASLTRQNLVPCTPNLAFDMMGAIVDYILISISQKVENVIVLEVEFIESQTKVKGFFFILPDVDSLKIILETIGEERE